MDPKHSVKKVLHCMCFSFFPKKYMFLFFFFNINILINGYIHDIKRLFVLDENCSFSTAIVLFNAQIIGPPLGLTN